MAFAVVCGAGRGVYETRTAALEAASDERAVMQCSSANRARVLVSAWTAATMDAAVFTDGSSLNNGRDGCLSAYAVWWGDDDPRNVASICTGEKHSNNVGELQAIIAALEVLAADATTTTDTGAGAGTGADTDTDASAPAPFVVATDSDYARSSIVEWYDGHVRNEWRTASGRRAQNVELICRARELLDSLPHVSIVHVPAHAGVHGNEQADKLARGVLETRVRARKRPLHAAAADDEPEKKIRRGKKK